MFSFSGKEVMVAFRDQLRIQPGDCRHQTFQQRRLHPKWVCATVFGSNVTWSMWGLTGGFFVVFAVVLVGFSFLHDVCFIYIYIYIIDCILWHLFVYSMFPFSITPRIQQKQRKPTSNVFHWGPWRIAPCWKRSQWRWASTAHVASTEKTRRPGLRDAGAK